MLPRIQHKMRRWFYKKYCQLNTNLMYNGIMLKMTERRKDLRPREKLQNKGAQSLTDHELLMAIIGSGTVQADVSRVARLAQKTFAQKGKVVAYQDLLKIPGLGPAKAAQLMAAHEYWRRQYQIGDRPLINSPSKVVQQLGHIRNKRQEYFVCLTLDGANKLINTHTITIGTLTASLVHPREVFAQAIADRAASIIVAHNHPSGTLQASDADNDVTNRLINVGEIVGIQLVDHIIVTPDSYVSII